MSTACQHSIHSPVVIASLPAPASRSTYYSFCGNAAATLAGGAAPAAATSGSIGGGLRAAVCRKWLHPIGMRDHPTFSSWVIYGARAGSVDALGVP